VGHDQTAFVLAPVPRYLELTGGVFHPSRPLVEALARYDANHGPVPGVEVIVGRTVSDTGVNAPSKRDSYELVVTPDRVTIRAEAAPGAFYGMMTLRQIVRQVMAGYSTTNGAVLCLRIRDWPDFANRGIMLDISRNRVPTMETIFHLVDIWSEMKINQVQLYTEHTFAYSAHTSVWKDSSPFTADEIRTLDQYCRDRFVELVPNQNSFGHFERWLGHEEYRHMAECPDGWMDPHGVFRPHPFSLSPAVPETLPFLSDLYDELLPAFSSKQFNVGCDETFDLGQGRSADLCGRQGTGRVYLEFLKRIHRLVDERGHTMLYWGDIVLHHPELLGELPSNAVALTWGYEASHPFEQECSTFRDSGVSYYVCPGTSAWNSVGGRWTNAQENIRNAARNGLRSQAAGVLTTEWGDNGHLQQFPIALPGFIYGAALSWTARESDDLPLEDVLSRHVFLDAGGKLAGALLALGRVPDTLGPSLHNGTILAAMLLDPRYPYYRERYREFRDIDFAACGRTIEAALEAAAGSDPASADGETLREEIVFTARLMKHACNVAEARLSTKDGTVREIAALRSSRKEALATELAPLIDDFRVLWTRRSRPGGLAGSVSRFEELLSLYNTGERLPLPR
jgi:hypothetical protein